MVDTCQYILEATNAQLEDIKASISGARMATYERFATGGLRDAIILYDINLSLSTHLFDLLHGFEITLRNKMAIALSQKYGTEFWFSREAFRDLVGEKSQDNIKAAKIRLNRRNPHPAPGQVIAELTLGFWTSLYATRCYQELWKDCFEHIWPAATRLDRLRGDLEAIKNLRNRIAHHEPVFQNLHLEKHKIILHRTKQLSQVAKNVFESRLNGKVAELRQKRNEMVP